MSIVDVNKRSRIESQLFAHHRLIETSFFGIPINRLQIIVDSLWYYDNISNHFLCGWIERVLCVNIVTQLFSNMTAYWS